MLCSDQFSSSNFRVIICLGVTKQPCWTHGFSRKGHKFSFVRSFVCSFFRNADISGSALQKRLIFCTKLEQHKCRKMTFSDFRKKTLDPVWAGSKGQIWPKIGLFQRLLPNCAPEFFDFLHEVRQ